MGKQKRSKSKSRYPKTNKRSKSCIKGWKTRRENERLQCINTATEISTSVPCAVPSFSPEISLECDFVIPQNSQAGPKSNTYSNTCPSSPTFESAENILKLNPDWCKKVYVKKTIDKKSETGIISSEEYESIMNDHLCIEKETAPLPSISGNRIVDMKYLLDEVLSLQYKHAKVCTYGKLSILSEFRKGLGLVSCITLQCQSCNKSFKIFTEDPQKTPSLINTGAVWGTLATGSTYMHLSEVLSCMDIPKMSNNLFLELECNLEQEWKTSLWRSMVAAGELERKNAVEKGHICEDGTPWITVYLDGSWSKRSYGNNYDALSGMVGIIGKFTGELLFVAVRNKFCSICTRAKNNNIDVHDHICYKNWSESAPAMEPDMVVEGFSTSETMHGVRYAKFIADGDSSTFAKIKEKVSYGAIVKKIECTNHALKNYGKHLFKIKKDTNINLAGRKLLTKPIIDHLRKRAKSSIYEHSKNGGENVELLKKDLEYGLLHVFGDHMNCRPEICNTVGITTNSKIKELRQTTMYNHLNGALQLLIRKAHLLINNENNNRAERLMNIVSRFTMGKRLNLIQRGSYERRAYLAGLRLNKKAAWHSSPWKRFTGVSPGKYFNQFMNQCVEKSAFPKSKRKLIFGKENVTKEKNTDYGPGIADNSEVPMCTDYDEEVEKIVNELQVAADEIPIIAESTIGQFSNDKYLTLKQNRLTASNFGPIINMRPYTSCHNMVKKSLGKSHFWSEATEYGIMRESVAISLFEEMMNLKVHPTGLWIDQKYGFLGASPDGLVGDDAIVEVKCLFSLAKHKELSLEELILKYKSNCLAITNGEIHLKNKHNYFYQIQGQLNILKKQLCYFVVYINDVLPIHVEEIRRDENVWENDMLPKLIKFYKNCIARELINKHLQKGSKCEDPLYIKEALECRNKMLEQNKK